MKLSTQVLVSVTLIALFATPSADGVLFWSWKKSSLLYFKRCWLSYDSKFCKGSASIHPQDNGGSDSLGMGTYPIVPIGILGTPDSQSSTIKPTTTSTTATTTTTMTTTTSTTTTTTDSTTTTTTTTTTTSSQTTTPPPTCPPYSEINFLHLFNFGTKLEEELALTTLTDSPSQNRIDKTISDLCLLTSFQCTTNSDCGQGRLCCAANAPSNSFKDTFDYSLDYYEHEDDVTEGPIIDEIKSRFCKICIFPH
ncbi:integumentary mucin C.1-like [Tigriopus californicus]|uniref:integumentary mucin C.1-like n=1 Tax=Tigriopus californicus TaxID=6832 RepID=UPI0027DA8911|nr:integumentary mucin C.1-like [Tigriopus californicus]